MKEAVILTVVIGAFTLRSAASYWILGLLIAEFGATVLLPVFVGNLTNAGAIAMLIGFLLLAAVLNGLFIYLIKHDEIRPI